MECLREIDFEPFQQGQLPHEQHQQVQQHLEHCPQCKSSYARFIEDNNVLTLLRDALHEAGEPVEGVAGAPQQAYISPRRRPASEPPADLDHDTITLTRIDAGQGRGTTICVPRDLGPVRLLHEIGRGGMAAVFKGYHRILGREVAVKLLYQAVAEQEDPEFTQFLEGARAAARVRHPALTTIHHADLVHGTPYLIMEYVDGPTLSQMLSELGEFSLHSALAVLDPVCAAVGKLHSRGIIHRDIKPSNILLDFSGQVYVTDFGLACSRGNRQPDTLFKELAGTPAYMAPEMFDGEVSTRSDVYALAVLSFQLLCNCHPFSGNFEEIRDQHRLRGLPLVNLQDRGVTPGIIEVIRVASSLAPAKRHASASHFLTALRQAVGNEQLWLGGARKLPALVRQYDRKLSGGTPPRQESDPDSSYFDHLAKLAVHKRDRRRHDPGAAQADRMPPTTRFPFRTVALVMILCTVLLVIAYGLLIE